MNNKCKVCYIAFISYIVLQIVLLLLTFIICISETVRDSGSLPFLLGLVSCGPCILIGLINVFLLTANARLKKKLLVVIAMAMTTISILYYLTWFFPVISRNIDAIVLRINGDATTSATISDYFLIVSHLSFIVAMILSTLLCGFLCFKCYNKINN